MRSAGKPPVRTGGGARAEVDGIGDDDQLIIWAGGVYNRFDPLTLVEATGLFSGDHSRVRLLFLGMRHPNTEVPPMAIAERTQRLADRLGLTDRHVFLNRRWVPYQQRQNWLLDADCGVTTHHEHVETTFAFRTRVLDYLWVGLPIVTTDGDSFADLVRTERLSAVVPAGDAVAPPEALRRTLYDTDFAASCRKRIAAVRESFTWESTLRPLVDFGRAPRPTADRLRGANAPPAPEQPLTTSPVLRGDLSLVRRYLDAGGPAEVARRATGRLRRLTRRT